MMTKIKNLNIVSNINQIERTKNKFDEKKQIQSY